MSCNLIEMAIYWQLIKVSKRRTLADLQVDNQSWTEKLHLTNKLYFYVMLNISKQTSFIYITILKILNMQLSFQKTVNACNLCFPHPQGSTGCKFHHVSKHARPATRRYKA